MKKVFLTLFVLFITLLSFSQEKSPENYVEGFFEIFKTGAVDKSIDYVVSTNNYMTQAKETIDGIKLKLQKSLPLIGKFYGYEVYSKKQIGDTYCHIKCILKFDRQPLIMDFVFYKPDKSWKLQNILFEEKPDNDLEDFPNLIK